LLAVVVVHGACRGHLILGRRRLRRDPWRSSPGHTRSSPAPAVRRSSRRLVGNRSGGRANRGSREVGSTRDGTESRYRARGAGWLSSRHYRLALRWVVRDRSAGGVRPHGRSGLVGRQAWRTRGVAGGRLFEALLGLLPILVFGLQLVAGFLGALLRRGLHLRGEGDRDGYNHQPNKRYPAR
jgi:hypothetical protein